MMINKSWLPNLTCQTSDRHTACVCVCARHLSHPAMQPQNYCAGATLGATVFGGTIIYKRLRAVHCWRRVHGSNEFDVSACSFALQRPVVLSVHRPCLPRSRLAPKAYRNRVRASTAYRYECIYAQSIVMSLLQLHSVPLRSCHNQNSIPCSSCIRLSERPSVNQLPETSMLKASMF